MHDNGTYPHQQLEVCEVSITHVVKYQLPSNIAHINIFSDVIKVDTQDLSIKLI